MMCGDVLLRGTSIVHDSLQRCRAGAPGEHRWLVRGLRESCGVLGDLLIAPDFLAFLNGQQRPVTMRRGIQILDQLREDRERLERFLAAEQELLRRAGLAGAADYLIERCRVVILEGQYRERADVRAVLKELSSLVCSGADDRENAQRWSLISASRDVFGGLGLAFLNGTLLAQTVGIEGGLASASMLGGATIANTGYHRFRQNW
jgi:hypothetical protein